MSITDVIIISQLCDADSVLDFGKESLVIAGWEKVLSHKQGQPVVIGYTDRLANSDQVMRLGSNVESEYKIKGGEKTERQKKE